MDIGDREKLTRAFDHMVEQVNQAVHEAEETLAPTVDEMVHNAQQLQSPHPTGEFGRHTALPAVRSRRVFRVVA